MKEKKRFTIYKKFLLLISFCEAVILFVMFCGYSTATKILASDHPAEYVHHYKIFCVVLLLLLVVTLFILVTRIQGRLRTGFHEITQVTKEMTTGKTDIEIKDGFNDEFTSVMKEYQELINASKQQAYLASQVASGNLKLQVSPRSEEDTLGLALKDMIDNNNHSLSNISDAARQVMTSSMQVAGASESLAQGSTEQASAIEEISASMQEIAENTKLNASEAVQTEKLIEMALRDVKNGNEQMKQMVEAMNAINESSQNISKIIKTIDDIAFQTNILALNAAVEAARAGEAGKGFAIVAEEVRSLAERCTKAASETSGLIENSISKINTGSNIAGLTAKALEDITKHVEESEKLVKNIAESSNAQAMSVAQINQGIYQVSQVVQNNTATSEECAVASEELSHQALRMQDLLNVYSLKS